MIVIKINPTSHSYYDYPMTMAGTKTGVSTVRVERIDGDWYSFDGRKLNGEPTKKGIYIYKTTPWCKILQNIFFRKYIWSHNIHLYYTQLNI